MPRPGMRRPSRRSYSGVVRPSTMPKIQMIAATLMNSGTVTKKPATKLRRSHWISFNARPEPVDGGEYAGSNQPHRGHGRQRQAIPCEHVERARCEKAHEERN